MSLRLLVVESDEKSCEALRAVLAKEGYQADCAGSAEAALKLLEELSYDLIITDIMLPGMDGIEFMRTIREKDHSKMCILMTARATLDTALKAIKGGASDYLLKPLMYDEVIQSVKNALMSRIHIETERSSISAPEKSIDYTQILGESEVIKNLIEDVRKIADSRSNVLIVGETGTGKELVARAIHAGSPRRHGPFIPINCSAVPETLLESEFFGYERGAFTGAIMPKRGLFEAADCGTLFLDEIGDLSQPLQAKLLRVMDDREIRPLGGIATKRVDIRFLAATNRDITKEVKEGRFREDLYYRLNVVTLKILPLRDRKGDIPILAAAFLKRYAKEIGKPITSIDEMTMKLLTDYDWPGNVRELQNIIERSVLLADGEVIVPSHLAEELRRRKPGAITNSANVPGGTVLSIEEYTKEFILRHQAENSEQELAEKLGITRKSLWEKRKRWGIKK
ncbi:MAG TPA: sigma-54 dependent transcriptional regulator [Dissulfurispiraceae bacterium]|nr:sigma-54 dependent transcriptional regulator [Dissulfurispiraceae bacterium]